MRYLLKSVSLCCFVFSLSACTSEINKEANVYLTQDQTVGHAHLPAHVNRRSYYPISAVPTAGKSPSILPPGGHVYQYERLMQQHDFKEDKAEES